MAFMFGILGADPNRKWLGAIGFLVPVAWSHAQMVLEFERNQYGVVFGESGEVEVRVMMDGAIATPGRQAVPNGLFSYGFLVRFDPARLQPAAGSPVVVDPALDFFGFTSGARVSQAEGLLGVKGNIAISGSPWTGTTLATIRLRFVGPPSSSTPLAIEVWEESPNESVFVDGAGADLDPLITPRPSLVASIQTPAVEWIPGAQPHARLTYTVPPGAELVLQWSPSMALDGWQDLPGAPHGSGVYLDFTTAARRFYRLTMVDR